MTLGFAITFVQFSTCLLGADTGGTQNVLDETGFPGPSRFRSAVPAVLEAGAGTACGSRPVRLMTAFWDGVYLPARVHLAHLAPPGTQARPLRGPDSRVGHDGGCMEMSLVGSGFQGLTLVMGQGPVE